MSATAVQVCEAALSEFSHRSTPSQGRQTRSKHQMINYAARTVDHEFKNNFISEMAGQALLWHVGACS